MVINNELRINYNTTYPEHLQNQQFTDDCIERELVYDWHDNNFTSMSSSDGINIIENIYAEILPVYVELIQKRRKDLVVKDMKGRVTLITVLPF